MKLKLYLTTAALGAGLLMTNSANAQWTRNAATQQTYLTNTGDNVGIGTTNPQFKLDIQNTGNASMSFKSATGNSNIIIDRANSSSTSGVNYRTNGVPFWQTGTVGTDNFVIRNLNLSSAALTILYSNSNVGIGTAAPANRLTVNGNANFTGNVGIGTTAPQDKLHINGGSLILDNTVQRFFGAGNPLWDISGTSSNYAISRSGIDYPFIIDYATGNVGVGTTTPVAKLDVVGRTRTVETGIGFEQVDLVNSVSVGTYADADGGWFGTNTNHPLNFYTNFGFPSVTLATSGNFGIGTTTPGAKLEVNGGALFNGGFVSLCTSLDNTQGNISMGTSSLYGNSKLTIFGNQAYGLYLSSPLSTGQGGAALFVDGDAAKNTGGSSWIVTSDARLKENINSYTDGLNELMKINPVKYHYTAASGMDASREYIGVLAQQLKEVAPYMVGKFRNLKDNQEYYNVDNSAMTYMLINAVKELNTKLEDVQAENTNLKQCVESLCNNSAAASKVGITEMNSSSLFQNQPNPFNQTTVIRYQLSGDANNGKIIIRDLNGNLVKQLSISQSGKGQVTINANELAQGTYTYTLEIGGMSVDTKLMVVTK